MEKSLVALKNFFEGIEKKTFAKSSGTGKEKTSGLFDQISGNGRLINIDHIVGTYNLQ